jgi:1-phosphatidylinositol-3-phosphate 5-kinase
VRVLRVSTYVLLSLLLEQHFFTSSCVELRYPKPITHTTSLPSSAATISHRNSSPEIRVEGKPRKRDLLRQTIWSLIQNRFNRSATLNTSDSRDVSLDLTNSEPDTHKTPRASLDSSSPSAPRQRRFSIFGESRTPPPSPVTAPSEPSPDRSFQSALRRIEEGKGLLSASPGLIVQPPQLLVRLAESERANPSRRLTGEERTGLTSILGWEGKTAAGRGNMTGIAGFLRQQQLSLLYAEHVRAPERTSQPSADGTANKPSEGGESKPPAHVHCGSRVQWLTYVYYASGNHDRSLGDMITSICMRADEPCTQPGCKSLQRQHERRWIHGGIRVVAQIEPRDPTVSPGVHSEDVEMWQSCKICQKATTRCKMSDGT